MTVSNPRNNASHALQKPPFLTRSKTVYSLSTNSREQQEIVTLSLQLLQNSLMLIKTILVEQTIEREGV